MKKLLLLSLILLNLCLKADIKIQNNTGDKIYVSAQFPEKGCGAYIDKNSSKILPKKDLDHIPCSYKEINVYVLIDNFVKIITFQGTDNKTYSITNKNNKLKATEIKS